MEGAEIGRRLAVDIKDAAEIARRYLTEVYAGSEDLDHVRLEEFEYDEKGNLFVTFGFSLPWVPPQTRSQEVLQAVTSAAGGRRYYKVLTIDPEGRIIAMKERPRVAAAE